MAILESDAVAAYADLARSLRQVGLTWVVADVELQGAIGKVKETSLRTAEGEHSRLSIAFDGQAPAKRVGTTAKFTASVEYTAAERLQLLIEATHLAVITLRDVAEDLERTLVDFGAPAGDIEFRPEGETKEAFTVRRLDLADRRDQASRLAALLAELTREIES